MSLVTGKVISVALGVQYPKNGSATGETYPAWVLSYMTDRNEKRDIVKHMNSLKFGAGPAIHSVLRELQAGDDFSAQLEKKGQFNEVVALVKGKPSVEMEAQRVAEAPSAAFKAPGKVIGSTYETPEERKTKQRLIVRQSSFDQARQLAPAKAKFEDIISQAEAIESWVYRGME